MTENEEIIEEYDNLLMHQGRILTRVANALNGPPGRLHSWSHHDLGEKAEALAERVRELQGRLDKVEVQAAAADDLAGMVVGEDVAEALRMCARGMRAAITGTEGA